jgi:hypothetical protein
VRASRSTPVEGQIVAFFEPDAVVPETYIGPGVEREEIPFRAGTRLDHRWSHKIVSKARRGDRVHGIYDERQRVYQTGGELKNFIYWKLRVVSIADEAWRQIFQRADWIEVIDHERNECWRIAMQKAVRTAVRYNAGIGTRVGVPMAYWDIIDANDKILQRGIS